MRYGIDSKLIDFGKREEIPMEFLALELLDLAEDVAKYLGSWEEVPYVKTILRKGTSADRQIRTYEKALMTGVTEQEALIQAVDQLVTETMAGV